MSQEITIPLWLFLAVLGVAWTMFFAIALDLFTHRGEDRDPDE